MKELKNEEYIKELKLLKEKMLFSESFAEKFPYFSKEILRRKATGNEGFNLGDKYKDIYLAWGIQRHFRKDASNVTNYSYNINEEPINKFLSSAYINSVSLFDMHNNFNIEEIVNKCNVFYYDSSNTTFYLEDEHLMSFLECLNDWYISAKVKASGLRKKRKIEEHEKALKELREGSIK